MTMCRYTIEFEPDDFAGWHTLIVDDAGAVYFVSASFPSLEDAAHAACNWIDHNPVERNPDMKDRIAEARDILAGILDRYPHWPVGLGRAHRLLEQVLAEDWWDEDDRAILAPDIDNEVIELTAEPPSPDNAA
jgi:hypothetical protein